jgi:hypothetical protein
MNQGGIMSVHPMKIARVAKDLNQEALAKICDVSRQTIGLIEAGKVQPLPGPLHQRLPRPWTKPWTIVFWPGPQDEGEN